MLEKRYSLPELIGTVAGDASIHCRHEIDKGSPRAFVYSRLDHVDTTNAAIAFAHERLMGVKPPSKLLLCRVRRQTVISNLS